MLTKINCKYGNSKFLKLNQKIQLFIKLFLIVKHAEENPACFTNKPSTHEANNLSDSADYNQHVFE